MKNAVSFPFGGIFRRFEIIACRYIFRSPDDFNVAIIEPFNLLTLFFLLFLGGRTTFFKTYS